MSNQDESKFPPPPPPGLPAPGGTQPPPGIPHPNTPTSAATTQTILPPIAPPQPAVPSTVPPTAPSTTNTAATTATTTTPIAKPAGRRHKTVDISSHEEFPTLAAGSQVRKSKRGFGSSAASLQMRREKEKEKEGGSQQGGVGGSGGAAVPPLPPPPFPPATTTTTTTAAATEVKTKKSDEEEKEEEEEGKEQKKVKSPKINSLAAAAAAAEREALAATTLNQPTSQSTFPQFQTTTPPPRAGLPLQARPLSQAGLPFQAGPSSQAGLPLRASPLSQAGIPLQAGLPAFHASLQATTGTERPDRWVMTPEEAHRAVYNIVHNLMPGFSTDIFDQAMQNRGGLTLGEEEDYQTQERVFATEHQNMRLRFAMCDLKQLGLHDAIEFALLKCAQNLMAKWYEPDINKIMYDFRERVRLGSMDRVIGNKMRILLEHSTRAKKYVVAKLRKMWVRQQAEEAAAAAAAAAAEAKAEAAGGPSAPADNQDQENLGTGRKAKQKIEPSDDQEDPESEPATVSGDCDGPANEESTDENTPTWELSPTKKSFVTMLQLAALWDNDKYKAYIAEFEPSRYTRMMKKRVITYEGDWEEGGTEAGQYPGSVAVGVGGGAVYSSRRSMYMGRFPDSFF
ncbi:hypothetical protein TWF281_008959 [Arthrobotrys megalospora]